MDFRKIKIEDKALFDTVLKPENVGWEYNFATLFLWDAHNTMMIAENDGYFCAYNTFGTDKLVFMPPYLADENSLVSAVSEMLEYAKGTGRKYRIRGFTKAQADVLSQHGFKLNCDRDDSDYIYRSDDLKYLKGKAYHSKRNFVSRFEKSYNFVLEGYVPLHFDKLIDLYDTWSNTVEHETMAYERTVILNALKHADELDLKIPVLSVDGKYIGFSITSIAPNGVAHTMFEKADTGYVGAFQAINKFAAEKYFPDGILVNRQEDMGIEGLRKAKLSYSPITLLDKYYLEDNGEV